MAKVKTPSIPDIVSAPNVRVVKDGLLVRSIPMVDNLVKSRQDCRINQDFLMSNMINTNTTAEKKANFVISGYICSEQSQNNNDTKKTITRDAHSNVNQGMPIDENVLSIYLVCLLYYYSDIVAYEIITY